MKDDYALWANKDRILRMEIPKGFIGACNTVIVMCANTAVRDSISKCLEEAGYPDSMVNVLEIPADTYRMGLEKGQDTFSIFGRVSQPEDRDA